MTNKKVKFIVGQLIKNYCHLGHPSFVLNKNSTFYIIGNYFNVSIINSSKTLILVKYSLNIIRKIFASNGSIIFVLNGIGDGPFPQLGVNNILGLKVVYNQSLKGGLISNYRRVGTGGLEPIFEMFPNCIVLNTAKQEDFAQERLRNFPIFILYLIDTINNVFKFDSFVMINTKSFKSSLYINFVFINFIRKIYKLKKIIYFENIKNKILNLLRDCLTTTNK